MSLGTSGANYAKNLLRTAVLVQYIPRLYRFLPFLAGQSPSGFIFESAWANFVINLLTFVLSGHVVGSCWYLFGLQLGIEPVQPRIQCDKTRGPLKQLNLTIDILRLVEALQYRVWLTSSAKRPWCPQVFGKGTTTKISFFHPNLTFPDSCLKGFLEGQIKPGKDKLFSIEHHKRKELAVFILHGKPHI
ncbi:putative cyclic nucleotide-gated ion channel 20, chloroplastic [Vitis vinifera]|uniref:Putative cyclic nucleotide-gated ion channel 20, chloroplastic n=1 Tax=Vitis vinifera TaxID=29760 RepID=A0A438D847_VITVI|nr:putative cyclic nucleotide-gated ion channel 20, chloroplastic [Vitis vinifera]